MKTILCPTDFSPVAQNALLYASEFGKRSGAEVVLFHTEFFPNPVGKEDQDQINMPSEYISQLKERLESLVVQLKLNFPEVKFNYVVEEGLVAENIALFANKHHVDLIIMGTTGASGMESLFEGSNTVRVMENAKCPVLIIPEKIEYKNPSLFVYATEGCDEDELVIAQLLNIAKLFDAEVELLQIKGRNNFELVNSEVSLNSLVERFTGEKIRPEIVTLDNNVEELEQYAKNNGDILVMIDKKKNFFQKLFQETTTEKLAYDAHMPLLVLHKP